MVKGAGLVSGASWAAAMGATSATNIAKVMSSFFMAFLR
jgi:hypothetical protein